jgi:molybdopterin biosynthesis enzyme
VRRNESRDEFVRARRETGDGEARLRPVTGQDSHMIASAARADALVYIRSGSGEVAAGELVPYLALA